MRFGLVPSPFVGPSTWRAVAGRMREAKATHYGPLAAPRWYEAAAERIVEQMDDEPWIAVLHSSAGSFAPSLAASAKQLRELVFVDAVLPHPGSSISDITPPDQLMRLTGMTSPSGLLPKWNTWFPPGVLQSWVPDGAARAAVLSDIPQVPFGFLEVRAPNESRSWEELPATFVKLSEGYERNAARAEERGWVVKRLETNHLGMVSHADAVAAVLEGLAA